VSKHGGSGRSGKSQPEMRGSEITGKKGRRAGYLRYSIENKNCKMYRSLPRGEMGRLDRTMKEAPETGS